MADATTLQAAIQRVHTELTDRLDPTVTLFDYAPAPEQAASGRVVYVSADGAVSEAVQFRVPVRLVVSANTTEEAEAQFLALVDTIETELDAASLGADSTTGYVADLNAWVCTWTVEVPRAYA